MTDKYERWNSWAGRYITDLMRDFGLESWQAAAFPGNFAAESSYFNDIIEDGALAKGSAGGTGHAQWTAARRRSFEKWLRRKGWNGKADGAWGPNTYEGNYSYLWRELSDEEKNLHYSHVIEKLKSAKDLEEAVKIVGKYYEAPAVLNMAPRLKGAQEALDLYHKLPPPADDHDVVVAALELISHDLQEIAQKVTALAATLKGSALPS